MSQISETAPRRARGYGARFALVMLALAAVVGISMAPVAPRVLAEAGDLHLAGPDLALWNRTSLAIKVHVICAFAAVALGAALMAARKGRRFHRVAGWGWVALVALVAGSSIFITSLNRGGWSLLHLFTAWTFIVLPLGVLYARRHKVVSHRRQMMGLFYGGFAINMFIAFIPGRLLWRMLIG